MSIHHTQEGKTVITLPFIANIENIEQLRRGATWEKAEAVALGKAYESGIGVDALSKGVLRGVSGITTKLQNMGLMNSGGRQVNGMSAIKSYPEAEEAPIDILQLRHHQTIIIAWANGYAIQRLLKSSGEWFDCESPMFSEQDTYRVKPGELPGPEEMADAMLRMNDGFKMSAGLKQRLEHARINIVSEGKQDDSSGPKVTVSWTPGVVYAGKGMPA
jgi:hypothetical protein